MTDELGREGTMSNDKAEEYGRHFTKAVEQIRALPQSERSALSNRRPAPTPAPKPPTPPSPPASPRP